MNPDRSGATAGAHRDAIAPRVLADPTDLFAPSTARREIGRERRRAVPRSAHAEFAPRPDRPDPLALLAEQNATRLEDLVPVRMGRMAQSPFAFLRGAAVVMAEDLANSPTTGFTVQACGDAHVANFGAFASMERRDVFDLNDFDETLVGPWEFDIKRLAASAAVMVTEFGLGDDAARSAVAAAVRSYRDRIKLAANTPVLDTWYRQLEIDEIRRHLPRDGRQLADQTVRAMQRRTSLAQLPKLTELTDQGRRIALRPPLISAIEVGRDDEEVREFVARYVDSLPPERRVLLSRFRVVDAARKVVGVGSVGTRCFIVLLMTSDDEPLFLQIKQAPPSVLERVCGPYPRSGGERVVTGQRSIQATSDIFLGYTHGFGHEFYVRQLRDRKYSLDLGQLQARGQQIHGALCGAVLARAHARTGDAAAISGYLGSGEAFVEAICEWAMLYAQQTRIDHARLVAAIADGDIEARQET